jgi:hypothetical protein
MQLRDLIRGGIRQSATATPATIATDGASRPPRAAGSVAEVATVAVAERPERWLERIRAGDLPGLSVERWNRAADALAVLMESGALAKAINLAWDARELVGVHRMPPHDAPHVAGLIWSMLPGDAVKDVRRSGCLIIYQSGRHIWLRRPLTLDTCLPWNLPV